MSSEELGLSADLHDDHFYDSMLDLPLQPQEEYAWDFSVSSVSLSRFSRIRQGLQGYGRPAFSVCFNSIGSLRLLSLARVLSVLGNKNAIIEITADMEFDRH